MNRFFKNIVWLCLMGMAVSCSNFQKVVKSTDYEYKLKKAKEYYDGKQYGRSSQLYQELVNIYRGTNRADQIYYLLAKSFYGQKDYTLASQYFRLLLKEFPRSPYAEESQYMIGYCLYLDSPNPRLDQKTTNEALDALQMFLSFYPNSSRVPEVNQLMDKLRDKLVYKSYLTGKLYYDLEDYGAAVISLTNSLKAYPASKYREELMFYLLKSRYLLAVNSVEEKKRERLNNVIDEYFTFVDEYPNSKFKKEADRYFSHVKKLMNLTDEEINQIHK